MNKSKKEVIKYLKETGLTYSEISRKLGISKCAVRHECVYKHNTNPKKRGPKFKIENKDKLRIKREIANLKKSEVRVNSRKLVTNCNLNVSTRTVQRYLKSVDLKYKKARSQIVLTKRHKEERIRMISQWISENHQWEKTIFSDEKRFSLDGPDNWNSYIGKNECIIRQKRQCKGGGVMVWIMVLPNGLLCHKIIRGLFNSNDYMKLLKDVTVPIAKLNFGDDFYFQEDNSPVHKAKIVQDFFISNAIKILKWPAKSPDLNIAEDIWQHMSNIIYDGRQFEKKEDLIKSINECISFINSSKRNFVRELYDQIRSRLCTVLRKQGNLYNV